MKTSMPPTGQAGIGVPTQIFTATRPACPDWCTNGDAHAGEARHASSSWYRHAWSVLDCGFATVRLQQLQIFEEQELPGDRPQEPGVFVEILTDDPLTVDQTVVLSAALRNARAAAGASASTSA